MFLMSLTIVTVNTTIVIIMFLLLLNIHLLFFLLRVIKAMDKKVQADQLVSYLFCKLGL